ncbi:cyanase [Rosenbergiella sp. S61]|uniref:Cyanate hydratase n=1 Tax=Rosenbergiella gaditana TaxID=2726987 RepID=A0ABS5T065_9GAMM|nr:cyanase [Rosenbergiella gaditana]MBT0725749.1 cyanase [Rosenbergiella gaditana]
MRDEITKRILCQKVINGIKWKDVADEIGCSKEWTAAACLGNMKFSQDQAQKITQIFQLDDEDTKWLQQIPARGCQADSLKNDPLIYRWQEIISVYGPALKEIIQEEFGDGIMSAVDFTMDIQKIASPTGDRVEVTLSGKFLPYRNF